jgi:hypothetical protein
MEDKQFIDELIAAEILNDEFAYDDLCIDDWFVMNIHFFSIVYRIFV